jgi:hypothetical protein
VTDTPLNHDVPHYLGDKWLAASAMQKAIRRGDFEIAWGATNALLALDRAMLWRRLACTAIEDVGPSDVSLIVEALTANGRTDLKTLIQRLCLAPKERGCDYLISVIQHHPELTGIRSKWTGDLSRGDYPYEHIESSDIEIRALLAWHAAGTVAAPGTLPAITGDPAKLFQDFRDAGVPLALVDACETALRKLRNPLPVLYPVLWQEISKANRVWTENLPSGTPSLVHGVPTYSLGQHTRLGKRAISAWVDKGRKLTLVLAKLAVPTRCWRQAAELGVFHVESAVIRPSLHWDARERPTGPVNLDQDPTYDDPGQWDVGSYLRERAIVSDFASIGFPTSAIPAFLEVVSETLPHLDKIRTAIIEREFANQQNGRQGQWNF